jgi:hypothetical protein
MTHFDPPGRVADFGRSPQEQELAEGWHTVVGSWLTGAVERTDGLFFNPNSEGAPAGGERAPVLWDAFPLVIRNWFDSQPDGDRLAFQAAETLRPVRFGGRRLRAVRDGRLAEELDVVHRQQDEYCEWFVERRDGLITGVQFTSEGPEYWEFLASGTAPFFAEGDPRRDITAGDPDLLLTLYREHISPDVAAGDLVWHHDVAAFDGTNWSYYAREGEYNRLNTWNTTHGAMHLTHPANTLGAEVSLAADATVLRDAPDDAEALICCAGYGDVNRSSDPLIGFGVNQVAAANNFVSLADPVGLYIAELNVGALSDPTAWRVTRGSAEEEMILRARVDIPDGTGLTVGGIPLEFGGQVAEHIRMVLNGFLVPRTGALPAPRGCEASCCTHPDRPAFKAPVAVGGDCSRVPWDALKPYLPPVEGAGPDLAGAESVPEPDILIAPRPRRGVGDRAGRW